MRYHPHSHETAAPRPPMSGGADSAAILRYLAVAGAVVVGLMMTLEPDTGFSAPPLARLLFWTLQVTAGLLVLQSVLFLLTRRYGASRIPSWALVLLSGVIGAAVLAPIYWLIGEGLMQGVFGYPEQPDEDLADLRGLFPDNPLLSEYLEIVGPLTTAWALICLPRLHWLVPPLLHRQSCFAGTGAAASGASASAPADGPVPIAPADPDAGAPGARTTPLPRTAGVGTATAAATSTPARPKWCERLPAEIGTDVIAIASELQYLRVWTSRGCTLILGALADVESEDSTRGMRVHRSWWVASEHVVSVRRTAAGAVCLMSDGRQVPVSRRRRAEVLARFGDGARYRVPGRSEAVAQTDLH